MARSESQTKNTQVVVPDAPREQIAEVLQAVDAQAALELQQFDNARTVARDLNYEGPLTVRSIEDEIRFYQKRTTEACLELGKRLLILKELTPHGEFMPRIELLGIGYQSAKKFMAATLKFSNRYSNTNLLKAANSQPKMLELVTLDDGEIEALDHGDTVRGLTLDSIEKMSVSELKKALREANELARDKDGVIQKKEEKITEVEHALTRLQLAGARVPFTDWPEAFKGYFAIVQEAHQTLRNRLATLEVVRADAMAIEAKSTEEEAMLDQARTLLADQLVDIHNDCAQSLSTIGLGFDRSLGAFSDKRIDWLGQ